MLVTAILLAVVLPFAMPERDISRSPESAVMPPSRSLAGPAFATEADEIETLPDETNPHNSIKVYFISDGKEFAQREVIEGTVQNPGSPPIPAGMVSFRGWFYEGSPFDFAAGNITESITLFANFSNMHLVKYKNAPGGDVIETYEIAPGGLAPQPTVSITPPAGGTLAYWYLENGDANAAFIWSTPVNSDITLAPSFSFENFVFFVSEGTQVPFTRVEYGAYLPRPENPSRLGYTFRHWSLNRGEAFDFNTPITQNTTLYAVWAPQQVKYTAAIWMERPNIEGTPDFSSSGKSQYNYVTAVTLEGLAGTRTAVNGTTAGIAGLFTSHPLLRYSEFQGAEQKDIQGNGLTVVNLYASRKVYTYTFNLGTNSSNTMTIGGTQYRGNSNIRYSLPVKFEMDISNKFPVQGVDFVTFSNGFANWTVGTGMGWEVSGRIASRQNVVTRNLLSQDGRTLNYTLTANWDASGSAFSYRYLAEALPGQVYTNHNSILRGGIRYIVMDEYSQSIQGNLSQKTINGLTRTNNNAYATYYWRASDGFSVTQGNSSADRFEVRCFFYTRDRFDLTFDMLVPAGTGVTNVPQNRKLMYQEPFVSHQPVAVPGRDGYTFDGWYRDADYKEAFDFAALTMPNGAATVYAKWVSTEFLVIFKDNLSQAATEIGSVGSARGAFLNIDEVYGRFFAQNQVVPGKGQFAGWHLHLGGDIYTAFSFDMPIYGDVTLYAAWATNGFRITYDLGAGSGTVPADTDTYWMGKLARAASGADITPPPGQIFIGWEAQFVGEGSGRLYYPHSLFFVPGDTEMIARYGNASDYINIFYHTNYPGRQKPNTFVRHAVLRNSPAELAAAIFEYPDNSLTGWAAAAGAEEQDYDLGAALHVLEQDIHLYSVWTFGGGNVTIAVNPDSKVYGEPDVPGYNGYAIDGIDDEDKLESFRQSITITRTDGGENAGWYPNALKVSGYPTDRYTVTVQNADYTITPRPVTVNAIADSDSIEYGDDQPSFAPLYDTLAEWDTETVLEGAPMLVSDYRPGDHPGGYGISVDVSGLSSPNYTFLPGIGSFTVEPKDVGGLLLQVDNRVKYYTQEDPAFNFARWPEGLDRTHFAIEFSRDDGEDVRAGGGYEISASVMVLDEFEDFYTGEEQIKVMPGTLTINKLPVTITPLVSGKDAGQEEPVLTAIEEFSPVKNLEAEWRAPLVYAITRTAGEGVGVYRKFITSTYGAESLESIQAQNPNYLVTVMGLESEGYTFTINPRTVVLVANSYEITAGDDIPEFTAYLHPDYLLANGDTTLVYSLYLDGSGTEAGVYPILFNVGSNPDYTVKVVHGTLTVKEASQPTPIVSAEPEPSPIEQEPSPTEPDEEPKDPSVLSNKVLASNPLMAPPNAPASIVTIPDQPPPLVPEVGISEGEEPLAVDGTVTAFWALWNLILTIITGIIMLGLFVTYFMRKEKNDEDEQGEVLTVTEQPEEKEHIKRRGFARLLSVIPAVAAIIVFILTQDMRNPMAMTDRWTWLMAAIAAVQLIVALFAIKKRIFVTKC